MGMDVKVEGKFTVRSESLLKLCGACVPFYAYLSTGNSLYCEFRNAQSRVSEKKKKKGRRSSDLQRQTNQPCFDGEHTYRTRNSPLVLLFPSPQLA